MYDATKDDLYKTNLDDRVARMLRLQRADGDTVAMERYGYAQVYATHALRRFLNLTASAAVKDALVRHARRERDVPSLNHWMESFLASLHALSVGYELSGEPVVPRRDRRACGLSGDRRAAAPDRRRVVDTGDTGRSPAGDGSRARCARLVSSRIPGRRARPDGQLGSRARPPVLRVDDGTRPAVGAGGARRDGRYSVHDQRRRLGGRVRRLVRRQPHPPRRVADDPCRAPARAAEVTNAGVAVRLLSLSPCACLIERVVHEDRRRRAAQQAPELICRPVESSRSSPRTTRSMS